MTTRRVVLGGLAAASFAIAAPTFPALAQPGLHVRRRAVDDPRNLEILARAVHIMRAYNQERPGSPFSWDKQRDIHANGEWRHHGNWRFLPWHRMQILVFEQLVRQVADAPGFALPYWDAREDEYLPEAFMRQASPLYVPYPFRRGNVGQLNFHSYIDGMIPPRRGFAFLRDGNFENFAGSQFAGEHMAGATTGTVESGTHGLLHSLIGGRYFADGDRRLGWMASIPTATLDPLFWLHHANIDRVWATWQSKKARWRADQYPAAFVNENVGRAFADIFPAVTNTSAGEVLSIDTLRYRYDVPYTYDEFAPTFNFGAWSKTGSAAQLLSEQGPVDSTLGHPGVVTFNVPVDVRQRIGNDEGVYIDKAVLKMQFEGAGFAQFAARVSIVPKGSLGGARDAGFCIFLSPFGVDQGHNHGSNGRTFSASIAEPLRIASEVSADVELVIEAVPLFGGIVLPASLRLLTVAIQIEALHIRRRA